MSANKNALLEPDLPANKYAQLEAILAATDFPVKKRLNRKQFKEQIDAAKKSYAVYLSSAVKEPEKITYVEFLATKKKTTTLVDSQKANVVVNEPLIAHTPEMRTTLLNEISRSILQEFDVAAARSLSTVQNSSLYHSKAQMDSQKANVVVNEPLIAPYTKTPQPKNKRFVPFESPCDAPAFCFDYINFPILEKKGS